MPAKQHTIHGRDHLPTGADPIPGFPSPFGSGILDIILSKSPVGLWKLDELSGDIAHDSSGAGNHMNVRAGATYDPPTWGEPAGPPGTTTALFAIGGASGGSSEAVTMPTGMVDDFSAGLWVHLNDDDLGLLLMGQGTSAHATAGWSLIMWISGSDRKFALYTAGTVTQCNNNSAVGDWYLFGVSRIAGTWTLYLDGLQQLATQTATPTAETDTWIGHDGSLAANHGSNQTMSWAFITDTPLSGADWLNLYEAGLAGGALEQGLVWTADGSNGASWQPNLATIAVTGEDALTGDVTLSEGSNVTLTQSGQDIEIAATGAAPIDDPQVWMPLTTVTGGVPELVWDGNDELIPTLVTI